MQEDNSQMKEVRIEDLLRLNDLFRQEAGNGEVASEIDAANSGRFR